MNEWSAKKDEELVGAADAGLRGQGALVEMLRRLNNSTTRLSRVNIFLSIVVIALAVIQIVIALTIK